MYYIIRFLVPWLRRLNITKKNFNNEYEDVNEYQQILLPELYLFIYDFIDRYREKNITYDVCIHHTVTILLIVMNMILSSNKDEKIKKILGLHQGVNLLNIHNSGDIFIRLPKILFNYDKYIGIVSGIFGLIYWVYTRNYIQYKKLIKHIENCNNINETKIILTTKTLIFMYVIGIFYTCKVIYYFKKIIIKNIS